MPTIDWASGARRRLHSSGLANSTRPLSSCRCLPTATEHSAGTDDVDTIWVEIRETSPSPAVMAEGRIVAAGALADQGDVAAALKLMLRVADAPERVREHHLKQWYVIADLYDRSGDVVRARNFFQRVVAVDPVYADAGDRLATLGRR